ncbi:hypothetical protein Vadar_025099 [Vaccinium darrowii]|uniref:Uncharacterized protein n=1 Tax=Vaccinium darrowii TaxID=229202 RepID=A0ACB7Z610_9ERIC|nr:hypothetical protein Vadar_025099 [Vaccinium darrowii]
MTTTTPKCSHVIAGDEPLFMASSMIIGCDVVNGKYSSTILTSASLLRTSPEINTIADNINLMYIYPTENHVKAICTDMIFTTISLFLKWRLITDTELSTASLEGLDDSFSLRSNEELGVDSDVIRICPGDMVVALERFFEKPNDLMAAPGRLSLDSCNLDCKELFRANCKISMCGIGGPLINLYGEVIGITFYDELCTPFLPTSIVSKCLENFKKDSFCRPWLGLGMTNLYAASLLECEKVRLRFPDISNGVFIEEVVEGSPAEHAGLCSNNIIIQFGGNPVKSFLELCVRMLEKTGVTVEIVLVRDTCQQPLHIAMKVDETSLENLYGWPLPKEFRRRTKRIR